MRGRRDKWLAEGEDSIMPVSEDGRMPVSTKSEGRVWKG